MANKSWKDNNTLLREDRITGMEGPFGSFSYGLNPDLKGTKVKIYKDGSIWKTMEIFEALDFLERNVWGKKECLDYRIELDPKTIISARYFIYLAEMEHSYIPAKYKKFFC